MKSRLPKQRKEVATAAQPPKPAASQQRRSAAATARRAKKTTLAKNLRPAFDPIADVKVTITRDNPAVEKAAGLSLAELCERLQVDYNGARYALARGIIPVGVDPHPGSGRHRRFSAAQAFQLAVALKINDAGVTLPLAGRMADWARRAQEMAVNAGWDHTFAPFAGQFTAHKKWRLEVGQGKLVRIVTNANPSKQGWDKRPWTDMLTGQVIASAEMEVAVVIQVDLVKIARLLGGEGMRSRRKASKELRTRSTGSNRASNHAGADNAAERPSSSA